MVALVKGEERYIFLFNDKQKSQTLRTLGRYASDSRLSFSWYDAAVLSQKVRNINQGTPSTAEEFSTRDHASHPPEFSNHLDMSDLPSEQTHLADAHPGIEDPFFADEDWPLDDEWV